MERLSYMWYEWGLNLEPGQTSQYVVRVGFESRAWRDRLLEVSTSDYSATAIARTHILAYIPMHIAV